MAERCKRVSYWTVEEVQRWVQQQYPTGQTAFLLAVASHSISGRALLRMGELQLSRMGIAPKQQQEILQGVMLLRVQEELENINDIFSECFSL
ncbi:sterile alpha motif domain-containing protein 12-like [Scleropages formosus]|uniref:sterile alpha motif domain-containing protein 12-like n=1 Tax=Scleropages formosus TaxID=113540 RepID=UPI000877EECB|nr:sterile alpha motif domain-containing protein 12-like [Scleropages formosus]